jgi:hypothetical protein
MALVIPAGARLEFGLAIPVVIPVPSPWGLAPDVPPNVVGPNAPVAVRFAWAKAVAERASSARKVAVAIWRAIMGRLSIVSSSASSSIPGAQ